MPRSPGKKYRGCGRRLCHLSGAVWGVPDRNAPEVASDDDLAKEAAFWRAFRDEIEQLVPVPLFGKPGHPGPVEPGLKSLRGEEVTKIGGSVDKIRRVERAGGQESFVMSLWEALTQTVLRSVTPFMMDVQAPHKDGVPTSLSQETMNAPAE